jgi:hypothetical protein
LPLIYPQNAQYTSNLQQSILLMLKKVGNTCPAESGELASGLSGQGRMAEPENIIAFRS